MKKIRTLLMLHLYESLYLILYSHSKEENIESIDTKTLSTLITMPYMYIALLIFSATGIKLNLNVFLYVSFGLFLLLYFYHNSHFGGKRYSDTLLLTIKKSPNSKTKGLLIHVFSGAIILLGYSLYIVIFVSLQSLILE